MKGERDYVYRSHSDRILIRESGQPPITCFRIMRARVTLSAIAL